VRLLPPTWDTIWKFPVVCEDDWELTMPAGSIPLSVGVRNGEPVLWAAVDSRATETELHRFHLRGTGHPLGEAVMHRFVGTFRIEGWE
jgi:hypothetical protein